jgi:hypothetical protein
MLVYQDFNLYFQDGNEPPVKLAHFEETTTRPFSPILSDDNQKVVFPQEDGTKIYAINTDGTHKRLILSTDQWGSFGAVSFVPNTHLLFFAVVQCNNQQDANSLCPTTAFLADTDTGKIRKLVDLGQVVGNINVSSIPDNIKLSPDGKMLAVGTKDGMKIFTLDGRLIHDNILPYTPSYNTFPSPTLSWLPDSSGLIVAAPDQTYSTTACDSLTAYTMWRYTIDDDNAVQIPLDPPPMGDLIAISPDGNWIAYGGECQPNLYLGNLVTGQTQVFEQDDSRPDFSWSSNSKHLIIHNSTLLTSLDKPSIYVVDAAWIDANHFLSMVDVNGPPFRYLIGEIRGDDVFYYDEQRSDDSLVFLKPK